MKFDGNLVWKQASAMISANRELVLALAGVFFFLPSFALLMLVKQPHVPAGATREQMAALVQPFLAGMAPWVLIGSIVQALGQMTVMGLLGRGGRPTVGEALRANLGVLLSYLIAQFITGFVITSILFLAVGLGSVISPVLGLAIGVYLVCQVYGRLLIAGAVIVLEHQKNPIAALIRSVALSRGNGFRIGNFLFLLALAVFLILMTVTLVIGILAALTIGQGRAAELLSGSFTSAVTALAIAYFAAVTVAVYRQFAGGPAN